MDCTAPLWQYSCVEIKHCQGFVSEIVVGEIVVQIPMWIITSYTIYGVCCACWFVDLSCVCVFVAGYGPPGLAPQEDKHMF